MTKSDDETVKNNDTIQDLKKTTQLGSIDFQDPMYLHPSDTPNLDLVTEVLRGSENYKIWSREMIIALEANNKLGFIDGSCKQPENDKVMIQQWKRCNALVRSWINRSLTRELVHGVVYCESASMVWSDLKERFDKVNGARLFSLYRQINTISQGSNSVTDYYSTLKQLWDEYDSLIPSPADKVSPEYIDFCSQLKMMQFLMGLNEGYTVIRSQILMMSPLPTHGQVYAMVLNEEAQRNINLQGVSSETTIALMTNIPPSRPQYTQAEKINMWCEHCKISGHNKEICFKIHGYPPNWGRGGRKGSSARRGGGRFNNLGQGRANGQGAVRANSTYVDQQGIHMSTEDHQHPEAPALQFTPQQYKQILNIIGGQETDQAAGTMMASANQAGIWEGDLDWQDKGDW